MKKTKTQFQKKNRRRKEKRITADDAAWAGDANARNAHN